MKIRQVVDDLTITKKTKENILRKSEFIDSVDYFPDGTPMFSWIDINLTELCNRLCTFCPRIDPSFYPNQNLHFSIQLAEKMGAELRDISYKGGVVFCGYGEPLLHPELSVIIQSFREVRTEVVTNGDKLSGEVIEDLFKSGLCFICVSLYDGPHQVEKFQKLFDSVGVSTDKYILRDRWHSEADQFGLKLTNRGGSLRFGPAKDSYDKKPCFYQSYSLTVDWNGDVLVCVQDWQKKVKYGNLNTMSIIEVWKSRRLTASRNRLILGNRNSTPCSECNTDGTMHGFNHANAWALRDGIHSLGE